VTAYGGLEHGVGRRHGRFIIQQGLVYYEDLDSTNGSFRNGIKLLPRQPQLLQHGDELRLGKLSLVIEIP
jgi:pSer/pThr/pTyr-binding forkhead associated (FHA) protein